jgi:hypothetical protein
MMNIPCELEWDIGQRYQRYKVDGIVIVVVVHGKRSNPAAADHLATATSDPAVFFIPDLDSIATKTLRSVTSLPPFKSVNVFL